MTAPYRRWMSRAAPSSLTPSGSNRHDHVSRPLPPSLATTMRANNALSADEVREGWVLTCQAVPTSREVVVDYDH